MTDVVNRSGGGAAQVTGPRPVVLSAVLAAGACLVTGLLGCSVVAVAGWLAATSSGASSAVRAGGLTWLAAHKAAVRLDGGSYTIAPLGLTLVLVCCLYRAGRFAARSSEADLTRDLVRACGVFALAYGAGAALIAALASTGAARVSPLSAFVGAATLALLGGTAGVLVESGAADDIADATPDWLRDSLPAGFAATAVMLAVAAGVLTISSVAHFGRATSIVEALDPGPVGAVVLFAICAVLLPNAVVYAVGFLAGPGFQLGTGTVVAPTGVELGPLPALPLLAALPADGATPSYLLVLTAVVPPLAGAAGGVVVAHRAATGGVRLGWSGLAARACLSALLAAGLLLVAMLLSGGSAGPGRMADVGVRGPLTAAATIAAGAVLGAVTAAVVVGRRRPPGLP